LVRRGKSRRTISFWPESKGIAASVSVHQSVARPYLTLAFAFAVSALGPTTQISRAETCHAEFALVHTVPAGPSLVTVPVVVDGSGPFAFLLDTGSQDTILEPALAQQLDLETGRSIRISVPGSSSAGVLTEIHKLSVGGSEARAAEAVVSELGGLKTRRPDVRGILGQSFLGQFDLLIDYDRGVLCLDGGEEMSRTLNGERVPMVLGDETRLNPERVLVPATLRGRHSRQAVLKLDCGGDAPILFAGEPAASPANEEVGGTVADGDIRFSRLAPQDVQIGRSRLRQVVFLKPADAQAGPRGTGEDGLLPTSLFRRVFISNHRHYVILNPD
jgi:hypothetical protein